MIILQKICAGIVLYNPEIDRLEENIQAILPQTEALVLVDNGSSNFADIIKKWSRTDKISVISNSSNKGVAYALNQICSWADKRGFGWVLTLDQDSVSPQGMIEAFSKYTAYQNVGIICPQVKLTETGNHDLSPAEFEYIERCITSASLTSVDAWKKVKGFDEWMFIDYVDYDFCIRLRLNNYRIIRVNSIFLKHKLGSIKEVNFIFGIKSHPTNHSVFRNYYIVRNSIYYIRKYRNNINIKEELKYIITFEIKRMLFEKDKIGTVRSALKAAIDGFKADIRENDNE